MVPGCWPEHTGARLLTASSPSRVGVRANDIRGAPLREFVAIDLPRRDGRHFAAYVATSDFTSVLGAANGRNVARWHCWCWLGCRGPRVAYSQLPDVEVTSLWNRTPAPALKRLPESSGTRR